MEVQGACNRSVPKFGLDEDRFWKVSPAAAEIFEYRRAHSELGAPGVSTVAPYRMIGVQLGGLLVRRVVWVWKR